MTIPSLKALAGSSEPGGWNPGPLAGCTRPMWSGPCWGLQPHLLPLPPISTLTLSRSLLLASRALDTTSPLLRTLPPTFYSSSQRLHNPKFIPILALPYHLLPIWLSDFFPVSVCIPWTPEWSLIHYCTSRTWHNVGPIIVTQWIFAE